MYAFLVVWFLGAYRRLTRPFGCPFVDFLIPAMFFVGCQCVLRTMAPTHSLVGTAMSKTKQDRIHAFAQQWGIPIASVRALVEESADASMGDGVIRKTHRPEETIFHMDVASAEVDALEIPTTKMGLETIILPGLDQTDPPATDPPPRRARSFLGRYEDLGMLGVGGMGEVRRVLDLDLRRTLAMKIIHEHLLCMPNYVSRFVEEAQVEAQLQHPNIVPVYEIGQLPDGRHYFTMKEIRGVELSKKIRSVHRASDAGQWRSDADGTSFRDLVRSFQRVCDAVAFSHSQGVIHRDLKPENIMLGGFGEVLVVDWGLAKVLGRKDDVREEDSASVQTDRSTSDVHRTRMGSIAGTPCYMAPEQAFGQTEAVGPWTDIYTLGAILYEILAGVPPYVGDTVEEVLEQVKHGNPPSFYEWTEGMDDKVERSPPLRSVHSKVPERLIEISTKAMQRDLSARTESVSLLATEIKAWLEGAERLEKGQDAVLMAQSILAEAREMRVQATQEWDKSNRLIEQDGDDTAAGWSHWDRCCALDAEAESLETQSVEQLNLALMHAPELEEAHRELAHLCLEKWVNAMAQGDPLAEESTAGQLRNHMKHLSAASRERLELRIVEATSDSITVERVRRGEIVGRHAQRESVVGEVLGGQRFITLYGMAGVGKTRLALELIDDLRCNFDCVAFCNLNPANDQWSVIRALSRTFGVRLRDGDPEDHLKTVLAQQPTLLVLDNLEQVVGPVGPMIEAWLQAAPHLVVCCTSRKPLAVPSEKVVRVHPLGLLGAVDLFGRRAQAANKDFKMTAANREQICAVVRQLDCLPLAIELAAARLNLLDLDQLQERFKQDQNGQALAAALGGSWAMLSPWAQVALAQSSIFHGGFSLAAAEKVFQIDGGPEVPGMFDILDELATNGWMRGDRTSQGEIRYESLQVVREYAHERLKDMGADGRSMISKAQVRHAHYFGALGAPEAIHSLHGADGPKQWELLFDEFDNLVAGIQYGEANAAAHCCVAALKVLAHKGPVQMGVILADKVLAMPGVSRSVKRLIEDERSHFLAMGI